MKKIIVSFVAAVTVFLIMPVIAIEASALQKLVDETPEGEELKLEAETYEGNIVIEKPITITGKKGTVIQGDHTNNVIEINSDDVSLNQLEVAGSGMSRDSEQEHAGVRVMGDNTVLTNLTIKESFHGVLLNRIDDTTMNKLTIIGSASENLSEQGNGIHILRSSNNLIENSYLKGFRDGIYVEYSDNNEVTNNTMTETRYGLHYMYSDYNAFKGNKFVHNIGGAAIMHSDHITLTDNEFSFNQGSRSFGLLIQSSREIEVLNNEFHLNQRGLLLEHATGNEVIGNEFFHNQIGIEVWISATGNVFSKNKFNKNTNHALTVGGEADNQWFDLRGNGNYWNEPMIDLDKDGIGDNAFEYTSSLGDLIEQNELAYLFLKSPAIVVYEKVNEILGNQVVIATDEYPLIEEKSNFTYFSVVAGGLGVVGLVSFYMRRKRGTLKK